MTEKDNNTINKTALTEEIFKLLIEATAEYAIFILNSKGIIQTWNIGAEHIFNYAAEDIIGKHFSCLYTKNYVKQAGPTEELKIAHEAGRFEATHDMIKKSGADFCAHVVINKIHSEDGKVYYGSIVEDLTVPTKAKKILRRLQTSLRLFIENTKEYALYLMSPQGTITTWNMGAERITGYKSNEIIGKPYSEFFTQADKDIQHPQEILEITGKQGWYEEEGYRVRKDGTLFWAYASLTAIRDKNGIVIAIGKITRDLTDRKTMEELLKKQNEELRIAKEEAEAANNAKSAFLSTMSHEIRTPLNSMTGMTELLLNSDLTDDQKRDLEIIRASEKQLLFVINNILDFTKVESGSISFENIQFELAQVINDLVKLLSIQAQKKGLKINVNIGEEVPSYLKGDPLRIRQILNNLLDNAIKFTESGQININIKVAQALHAEVDSQKERRISLLFEIIDTGIGFSEDVKQKLFQPFIQGDPTISRKYGGSGLGLIISKKLIEGMNGTLGVESKEGTGSKFWFVIPLIEGTQTVPKDKYKSVVKRFPPTETDKENFHILLAEDNETNRDIALRILKKFGYHADTVADGIEVLKLLENHHYDLIIMDCQMPKMDGYTATKTIRQLEATHGKERTPIVAMTANALIGDQEKCLLSGMDDYLSKPINLHRLNQIIDGWLILKMSKNTSQSLIDMNRLHEILGTDKTTINIFLTAFIKKTNELLTTIEEAIKIKDEKSLKENLHKLKGSSINSGVTKISDLCVEAENSINDWEKLDKIYQQLILIFQALQNEAKSLEDN